MLIHYFFVWKSIATTILYAVPSHSFCFLVNYGVLGSYSTFTFPSQLPSQYVDILPIKVDQYIDMVNQNIVPALIVAECSLMLERLKDVWVVSGAKELHLARVWTTKPSVHLAVMKALVSTAIRLTIWSNISEVRDKNTTTVFSNTSAHFYKYKCLNGRCHLTRDLVSAHSSNCDPIQETGWVLFCKTMVYHIHYMMSNTKAIEQIMCQLATANRVVPFHIKNSKATQ